MEKFQKKISFLLEEIKSQFVSSKESNLVYNYKVHFAFPAQGGDFFISMIQRDYIFSKSCAILFLPPSLAISKKMKNFKNCQKCPKSFRNWVKATLRNCVFPRDAGKQSVCGGPAGGGNTGILIAT